MRKRKFKGEICGINNLGVHRSLIPKLYFLQKLRHRKVTIGTSISGERVKKSIRLTSKYKKKIQVHDFMKPIRNDLFIYLFSLQTARYPYPSNIQVLINI